MTVTPLVLGVTAFLGFVIGALAQIVRSKAPMHVVWFVVGCAIILGAVLSEYGMFDTALHTIMPLLTVAGLGLLLSALVGKAIRALSAN